MKTRRYSKGVRLADALEKVSKPFFMKSGGNFTQKILFNWQFIVGEKFALASSPSKIEFPPQKRSSGTLFIKVSNPSLSLALSAMESSIVSKIAQFFGFQVVSRIRVVVDLGQALGGREAEEVTRKIALSSEDLKRISKLACSIEDEASREAMERLIQSFCDIA